MITRLLVHSDTEFAPDIILEFVIVTVQVILGDIGQDSYIRSELLYVIQLETADLYHVQCARFFSNLQSERVPDISHQCAIKTG